MHAQTFPTKTAAVQWSRETETDVRRGDWIDPRLGRRTFRDWSDEYLSTIVHLRTVTRRDYERQLRVHIVPVFGDRPISQIDQVDIRRFMSDLRATGMAPKTLQKVRLVLRQVLETARGSGAIKANPCEGIRLPRAEAKEPIFLTPEQVEVLPGRRDPHTASSSGSPPPPDCGPAKSAACGSVGSTYGGARSRWPRRARSSAAAPRTVRPRAGPGGPCSSRRLSAPRSENTWSSVLPTQGDR